MVYYSKVSIFIKQDYCLKRLKIMFTNSLKICNEKKIELRKQKKKKKDTTR